MILRIIWPTGSRYWVGSLEQMWMRLDHELFRPTPIPTVFLPASPCMGILSLGPQKLTINTPGPMSSHYYWDAGWLIMAEAVMAPTRHTYALS